MIFEGLFVAVGLLWTLTYLMILRRGFLDRTYGMPAAALCANVSWEILDAFVWPQSAAQTAVNAVWFLFDLVLIGQFLRFGPAEHPEVRLYTVLVCKRRPLSTSSMPCSTSSMPRSTSSMPRPTSSMPRLTSARPRCTSAMPCPTSAMSRGTTEMQ